MSSTFDQIANIIAETCDIPRDTITPESHAIDDLGIDSLDFLDIAFAIDKAFGIKMPLEKWTQEVNDGKATTEQYFVLKNLADRIDELVAAKNAGRHGRVIARHAARIFPADRPHRRPQPRRARPSRSRRRFPRQHTIFEGHFPGYPIMPGVLLTEAMAQSSGWLLLGVMKFERMPFLAMVKEAKMRGFVSPGQLLTIEAKIEHEGSGFAVTSAKVRVGKELKCSADLTFRLIPFPDPDLRVHMDAMANKIGFPLQAMTHD